MSDDLPKSVLRNTLTIMGVELVVHQLDNGQRIIEADSVHRLFEAMAGDTPITPEDAMEFARVVRCT